MSAIQLIGSAMRLARQEAGLVFGISVVGIAPLCIAILGLHHVAIIRQGAARNELSSVLPLAGAVVLALCWRTLMHAALLRVLDRRLSGEPAQLGESVLWASRRWMAILLVGLTSVALAVASGFLYFAPVPLLGGLVLRALPRCVLDDIPPRQALLRGDVGATAGKAMTLNFLYFVAAGLLVLNLFLLGQLVLSLARVLFDVDVSYLTSVLSLDNSVFVLALILGSAAVLEPVRVLSAGLLHLEEKVRSEGLDLQPRIEALRRRRRTLGGLALLAIALGLASDPTPAAAGPRSRANAEAASELALDLTEHRAKTPRLRALISRNKRGRNAEKWVAIEKALDRHAGVPVATRRRSLLALVARLREPRGKNVASLVRRILAREEFQNLDARMWDRLARTRRPPPPMKYEPLFGEKSGEGISGFAALAVALSAGAVALILMVVVKGRSRRRGRRRAAGEETGEPGNEELGTENALSYAPAQWRSQADALAGAGRYREALRSLYLAVLVSLHRARLIEYERSRTNWDYLRRFRGPTDGRRLFRELTEGFDYAWYGERPTQEDDYRRFDERASALIGTLTVAEEST